MLAHYPQEAELEGLTGFEASLGEPPVSWYDGQSAL